MAGKTPHGAPGKARGLNSPHYLHGIEKPHVNTDGPDDIGENFISHFATFLLLVPWIYSVLYAIVAPWMPRPQSASVSWCFMFQTPQTLGPALKLSGEKSDTKLEHLEDNVHTRSGRSKQMLDECSIKKTRPYCRE